MLMNVQTAHCICAASTVTTLKVVTSVTAMSAMSCRMMISLALVSKILMVHVQYTCTDTLKYISHYLLSLQISMSVHWVYQDVIITVLTILAVSNVHICLTGYMLINERNCIGNAHL